MLAAAESGIPTGGAEAPFQHLRYFAELDSVLARVAFQGVSYLAGRHAEETFLCLAQACLQADRVLAEDEGVHVEAEGNGSRDAVAFGW
ncbi:hypothetical protein OG285_17955 [Streptomyces sp. NBC_01471]|uniref:hypothetical protein n=1 Tax=Streptomyces sp. NBC_01471 TaxID=2903879 RepID=UPI00325103DD